VGSDIGGLRFSSCKQTKSACAASDERESVQGRTAISFTMTRWFQCRGGTIFGGEGEWRESDGGLACRWIYTLGLGPERWRSRILAVQPQATHQLSYINLRGDE
jgi:hypothetical protein